nr:serine/threonine-protein kinase PLK4-like [Cherax quadricarinatus]
MNKKNEIGGSIEEYDVGTHLGRGGFATVYCAKCRNTGRDVAIKKINKSEITAGGLISRVRQEVTIHSQLSHPAILKLYTFFEDQQFVYLVLELCTKGELQKHLKNLRRVLAENEAREYLSQIVSGMLYLHSQSIMHRDLTLSNILLDNHGRIKIADFGLATQLRRPDDRHTTMCGTPNYISPEVVTRSSHGLESDVWSLGCMLFIMLVGHPPFDSKGAKESIFTNVVIGDYKVPSYVSVNARNLISECLQKNPKERIKLEAIPNHPFMNTGNKVDVSRMSDSGLYTMTTVTTTHHTRAPLASISESDLSCSEGSGSSHTGQIKPCSEPLLRHPSSPPVRMKSSPRDLLPPNAGVIDSLKKKFTPLPSLKGGGNFAFTTPLLPPSIKRERDVSEERNRQQNSNELRCSSSSSCDDQCNSVQYSSSRIKDEVSHHIPGERKGRARSNSRSRSNDCGTVEHNCTSETHNPSRKDKSGDYNDNSGERSRISYECSSESHKNELCNQYSGHQNQGSGMRSKEIYSDCRSRSLEKKCTSGQESRRLIENQLRSVENCQQDDPGYRFSRSRERCGVPRSSGFQKRNYVACEPMFVKLLKSKTTKITYYTDQAKFFLMENSPDPDFVATFYHGTKLTKSGNNLVIKCPTGASHSVSLTPEHKLLPDNLEPLYLHFKQVHDHCLYLERVLSEVKDKTKMDCFPVILGRKPVSTSSPSESTCGKLHPTSDKENFSPTSIQSYRSPRNILTQLGSFEDSLASYQVLGNSAPRVRVPHTPHTYSNLLVNTCEVKHPVSRVYVQNIGWASRGRNGVVCVEYLDGTQVEVSSNSPKVIFTDASGVATTFEVKDKLPLALQNKLSHMSAVLNSLTYSPASSTPPPSSYVGGLR